MTYTIEQVKQKIREQQNYIKADLQLYYEGTPLENDKLIGYYGIKEESIVQLILKPRIWFSVKTLTGQTLHLDIDPTNATIKDVKIAIEKSIGTPVIKQRLELAGNNDLPLKECSIENDCSINMVEPDNTGLMTIRVKNYSQTFFFEVHPTDTIMDVKKKIMASQTVDTEIQRIIYKGKELENDVSMADVGIQDDYCLWLLIKLAKVTSYKL